MRRSSEHPQTGRPTLAQLIPVRELHVGQMLPQALFSRQGIKLLPPHVRLTDAMIGALRASGEPVFVMAQSVSDIARARMVRRVRPSRLTATHGPIISEGGVLTAEPGQPFEEHHLDAMAMGAYEPIESDTARGPFSEPEGVIDPLDPENQVPAAGVALPPERSRPWAIRHDQLARVRSTMVRLADDMASQRSAQWERHATEPPTGVDAVVIDDQSLAGWPDGRSLLDLRARLVQGQRQTLARLTAGLPVKLEEPSAIVQELIALHARWPRRFCELALNTPRRPEYLPDHMLTTACLCVAMSSRARWARSWVLQAGLAGLLSDVGMTMIPEGVRRAERPLDEAEVNRVRRHPAIGLVLLEAIADLPSQVGRAVYEHHERSDASGYPRGIDERRTHPISRMVAVADVFAALTAPRPHREPMLAYDAMEQVVRRASAGELDRAIARLLVRCCGLFPVSSIVRLSDESLARVIGSHPEMIDRPVVHVIDAAGRMGEVIDLSTRPATDLSVLQAVDASVIAGPR